MDQTVRQHMLTESPRLEALGDELLVTSTEQQLHADRALAISLTVRPQGICGDQPTAAPSQVLSLVASMPLLSPKRCRQVMPNCDLMMSAPRVCGVPTVPRGSSLAAAADSSMCTTTLVAENTPPRMCLAPVVGVESINSPDGGSVVCMDSVCEDNSGLPAVQQVSAAQPPGLVGVPTISTAAASVTDPRLCTGDEGLDSRTPVTRHHSALIIAHRNGLPAVDLQRAASRYRFWRRRVLLLRRKRLVMGLFPPEAVRLPLWTQSVRFFAALWVVMLVQCFTLNYTTMRMPDPATARPLPDLAHDLLPKIPWMERISDVAVWVFNVVTMVMYALLFRMARGKFHPRVPLCSLGLAPGGRGLGADDCDGEARSDDDEDPLYQSLSCRFPIARVGHLAVPRRQEVKCAAHSKTESVLEGGECAHRRHPGPICGFISSIRAACATWASEGDSWTPLGDDETWFRYQDRPKIVSGSINENVPHRPKPLRTVVQGVHEEGRRRGEAAHRAALQRCYHMCFIRFWASFALLIAVRCVVISATVLPATDNHCQRKPHVDNIWRNTIMALVTSGGAHIHCGDLMYSGHTLSLTLTACVMWAYGPLVHRTLRWVPVVALPVCFFAILASRSHYTDDIVIAFFVTFTTFRLIGHDVSVGAPLPLQVLIRNPCGLVRAAVRHWEAVGEAQGELQRALQSILSPTQSTVDASGRPESDVNGWRHDV